MAKISTYPNASSPQLSDMLIGSEVGDGNATKNFTIASILGLANLGSFVPYTGATENVDLGAYNLTADSAFLSNGLTVIAGLAEFNGPIQAIGTLTLDSQLIDGFGNPGTSGQLLSTNGVGTIWETYGLQEVLDAGDAAADVAIVLSGASSITAPTIESSDALIVGGTLEDADSSVGTAGQVLSSTGTGTEWISLGALFVPYTGATQALNLGIYGIIASNGSFTNDVTVLGDIALSNQFIDGSGSPGTPGQILSSTGSETLWINSSAGTGFVPYVGATQDLNLGIRGIQANGVSLGSMTVSGPSTFAGAVFDGSNSLGTPGQVLSSTGAETLWINPPAPTGLVPYTGATQSLNLGLQNIQAQDAVFFSMTVNNLVVFPGLVIDGSGSPGTPGQILSSTGSEVLWVDPSSVVDSYKGSFYDNSNQALTAGANQAVPIILGQTDAAATNGVSVVTDGTNLTRITVANAGVYNISFSAQLSNGTGSSHVADFWLRKNGQTAAFNVPNSNRNIHVQSNTSDVMAAWNYFIALNANDYIYLMWTANSLAVSINPDSSTAVKPSGPSVVVTINKI
jgi:hypothetical protein